MTNSQNIDKLKDSIKDRIKELRARPYMSKEIPSADIQLKKAIVSEKERARCSCGYSPDNK